MREEERNISADRLIDTKEECGKLGGGLGELDGAVKKAKPFLRQIKITRVHQKASAEVEKALRLQQGGIYS